MKKIVILSFAVVAAFGLGCEREDIVIDAPEGSPWTDQSRMGDNQNGTESGSLLQANGTLSADQDHAETFPWIDPPVVPRMVGNNAAEGDYGQFSTDEEVSGQDHPDTYPWINNPGPRLAGNQSADGDVSELGTDDEVTKSQDHTEGSPWINEP